MTKEQNWANKLEIGLLTKPGVWGPCKGEALHPRLRELSELWPGLD